MYTQRNRIYTWLICTYGVKKMDVISLSLSLSLPLPFSLPLSHAVARFRPSFPLSIYSSCPFFLDPAHSQLALSSDPLQTSGLLVPVRIASANSQTERKNNFTKKIVGLILYSFNFHTDYFLCYKNIYSTSTPKVSFYGTDLIIQLQYKYFLYQQNMFIQLFAKILIHQSGTCLPLWPC